jgi:hypothetical protein
MLDLGNPGVFWYLQHWEVGGLEALCRSLIVWTWPQCGTLGGWWFVVSAQGQHLSVGTASEVDGLPREGNSACSLAGKTPTSSLLTA